MTFGAFSAATVNAALSVCVAFLFYGLFWQRKKQPPLLFANTSLCLIIAVTALVLFKGRAFSYVMLFSAFFLLSYVFTSNWIHKVLLTGLFTALLFVMEMIIRTATVAMFGITVNTSYYGKYYISVFVVAKALMLLVIYFIHYKKHKPFTRELDGKYLRVICFPVTSALVIILQHSLMLGYKNLRPTVFYFVLVIDLALFVSNMVVFDYIDSLYYNAVQKSNIAHVNKLLELQALQYKNMVENNYNIRKTKHDFKNFCIGLVSELRAGKTESVIDKLCDVYDEASINSTDSMNVIEVLLKVKAEEAAKKDIKLKWDCCNLPSLRFSDVDLAIILGNAIDNAVEATQRVEKDRMIDVFITLKNNIIVIKIKNSVVDTVDVNNLNSTKPDRANHGFGIMSMKQLVDKYDGELLFSCEDFCFTTDIIMSNLPASICK